MAYETLKQNLIKSKYTQVINPLIASLPSYRNQSIDLLFVVPQKVLWRPLRPS